ncbi:response regulator transcription factor [Sphingomonas parva]|uniref:Response regulator transcription factor n=1 Tax=Sphingomonas parva TaxID=2555898 RepID=A0A4Y8ZUA1_9SPHN|nr:response regulator transcription factor [Sphingomonas parva]TFI59581.1 response regulator transcription factor [Sphingomonas parva]
MRILLVEPDVMTRKRLSVALSSGGFNVEAVASGEDALDLARSFEFSVIVSELNLPDLHGFDLIRKLRAAKIKTPLLVLSTVDHIDTKVAAFGDGADDYVTKPFHPGELAARLRALVRRSSGHADRIVRTGGLSIDLDAKTVELDGNPVDLTAKEYAVLELLALRRGRPITKEMFLDHVYGHLDEPISKVIDVYICRLRKKLAATSTGESYIGTLRGRGYVLREPESEPSLLAA